MKAENQNNISPNKSNTEQMAIKTTLKISQIKNNPNNPRLIKDDKFKKLVKSLKEFPIMAKKLRKVVVDENNVILGGNMRFKAMKEAGLEEVYVEYFTREDAEENNKLAKQLDPDFKDKTYEDQCNEFIIKDNVSGGEWDMDILANEWDAEELDEWGLDTPDTWGEDKEVEEDEAPEVDENEPPKSKLGEIYQLGRHRVMCADSTVKENVEKLMDGNKADMVFTDPPYNVAFNGRSGKFDVIENDDLPENEFEDLINGFVAIVKILNPKNYYVWCNWKFYGVLQSKLEFKSCIVWAKNVFGLGCGYRHQHEFCLFNGRVDDGINNESDLWSVKKDINHLHPTQKPIELAARALNNHKGDKLIVDLFSGSGLTFIASHQLNRKCYGMELDPKYCQVIIDRMLNSYPDIEVKINGHKYQQLQTV